MEDDATMYYMTASSLLSTQQYNGMSSNYNITVAEQGRLLQRMLPQVPLLKQTLASTTFLVPPLLLQWENSVATTNVAACTISLLNYSFLNIFQFIAYNATLAISPKMWSTAESLCYEKCHNRKALLGKTSHLIVLSYCKYLEIGCSQIIVINAMTRYHSQRHYLDANKHRMCCRYKHKIKE